MARIDWDLQKYDGEFKKAGMDRLKRAADVIRDMAKANCKVGTIDRPARKHWVNAEGHFEDASPLSSANIWTAREIGAMKATIRTVELNNPSPGFDTKADNVRIYAGNFKTWWAIQMEYGRGGWKGGPRSFMRPALVSAPPRIRSIIEGTE